MRRAARRAPLFLGLALSLAACGEDAKSSGTPPPPPPKPAGEGAAPKPVATAGAAPTPVATALSPGRDKVIADLRKRPFRSEDMVAVPPTNTDPFHNNIEKFITAPPPPDKSTLVAALLPKYNLEELKLSAIILGSGDTTASRAMLIDPAGVGHTIKRGDRVSKTAALVQRILSDRVLFEFTEDLGQGKKRTVVRAVELHPAEAQDSGQGLGVRAPLPPSK